MSDYLISVIRTWVPKGIGAALGWLVVHFGITVELAPEAIIGIVAAMESVYYAVTRKLEERWPWFGRLLGIKRPPTYVK